MPHYKKCSPVAKLVIPQESAEATLDFLGGFRWFSWTSCASIRKIITWKPKAFSVLEVFSSIQKSWWSYGLLATFNASGVAFYENSAPKKILPKDLTQVGSIYSLLRFNGVRPIWYSDIPVPRWDPPTRMIAHVMKPYETSFFWTHGLSRLVETPESHIVDGISHVSIRSVIGGFDSVFSTYHHFVLHISILI